MMGLTPKQAEAKAFISDFIRRNGIGPTYEQIAAALNLASKAGVSRVVIALEERGHLRRQAGRARALEIVGARQVALQSFSDDDLLAEVSRRGLQ
jgi:repressor LexA